MTAIRTGTIRIQTPEGIEFSLTLAGPVSRFLAWAIDFVCVMAATSMSGAVFGIMTVISADLTRALTVLSYFLVSIGYGMAAEWYWRGQTIGKRLIRLRVVDRQGLRLQFSQVVFRNLMRFVDSLPALYLVGGAACLLSRNCQRLGDLAANTVVIRHPVVREPDLKQILSNAYNSLSDHPHLCNRLRQHIMPHEAEVALQALLRRNELDPGERVELFGRLASHFRSVVAFPEEATEGLADEQYVRNVLDIIYRKRLQKPGPSGPPA